MSDFSIFDDSMEERTIVPVKLKDGLNPIIEESEYDELIEDARMSASTDFEENFVDDISALRVKSGGRLRLSEAQIMLLNRIANGEEKWNRD